MREARAHLEQKRYTSAEAVLNDAVQQYPDEASVYYLQGLIRFQQHQYDAALASFEKAYHLDPKDATALRAGGIEEATIALFTAGICVADP